jgi:hypothetical protein
MSGQFHVPTTLIPKKEPVPIEKKAGWAPEPVWTRWGRQKVFIIKFSQTISQVKWLNGEKTNISKTISVLVLKHPEDGDRCGLWYIGFFHQSTT